MNGKKKASIGILIAVLGLLAAMPAVRDEFAWWRAALEDSPPEYELYFTDWPNGLHVGDARLRYKALTWDDTKRAMIADAIKKHATEQSNPEARNERKQRMELLWWKQVTNQNTLFGYQDYLQHYPQGAHAAEVQRRIAILSSQNSTDGSNTNASGN